MTTDMEMYIVTETRRFRKWPSLPCWPEIQARSRAHPVHESLTQTTYKPSTMKVSTPFLSKPSNGNTHHLHVNTYYGMFGALSTPFSYFTSYWGSTLLVAPKTPHIAFSQPLSIPATLTNPRTQVFGILSRTPFMPWFFPHNTRSTRLARLTDKYQSSLKHQCCSLKQRLLFPNFIIPVTSLDSLPSSTFINHLSPCLGT